MMKYRIIILFTILFFTCSLPAHSATGLMISRCQPVTRFGEPPYILLTYEYPYDFKKSGEEITVNGRKLFYEHDGGGGGSGRTFESVLAYVGPPGKKQIKVIVRSADKVLSVTKTIDFHSRGDILLLDRTDGEALFFPPGEFHFFGYFIKDLKMGLNGEPLKFRQEPLKVSAYHFKISCRPELRQGENTLTLSWKGADGKPRSRQYHFYLAKHGIVKQGDSLTVTLGRLQSRMGPFYYAKLQGSCFKGESGPTLGKEISYGSHFLSQSLIIKVTVKAQQPGKGVFEIYKKAVFYNPAEINRTIKVTVVK